MQSETIAQYEATIASLEHEVQGMCVHAQSCIQQSEAAAHLAMNQAQAYRDEAASAMQRAGAAEAALVAASESLLDLKSAEAGAAEREKDHRQQLKRVCDTYETRIEELSCALEASKQACGQLQQRLDAANCSVETQHSEQQLIRDTYEDRIEKLSQS